MIEQIIKNIFIFLLTRNYDPDMKIEENKGYVKEIIHLLFD